VIDCIFTLDYEIYGNGEGSLRELVYDPTERLMAIFRKWKVRFVPFVEVAELEMIESSASDPALTSVKQQIRELHGDGFELGLHLHPQWYNAKFKNGTWLLDFSEYNLCTLRRERIEWIVQKAINYLRETLNEPEFVPLSFRAGNWLFQPTATAASVLAGKGIRLDSSVFKGGRQRDYHLDYRAALHNGYYWSFQADVNVPNENGRLLEVPIYSEMVPLWKMYTRKRVALQRKATAVPQAARTRVRRVLDLLRWRYPLKLDFCRMTIAELTAMLDKLIQTDREDAQSYRPIVAIGHSKDLVDFETVDALLGYLSRNGIRVVTFEQVLRRCHREPMVPARNNSRIYSISE
jgi:hypothetical protein